MHLSHSWFWPRAPWIPVQAAETSCKSSDGGCLLVLQAVAFIVSAAHPHWGTHSVTGFLFLATEAGCGTVSGHTGVYQRERRPGAPRGASSCQRPHSAGVLTQAAVLHSSPGRMPRLTAVHLLTTQNSGGQGTEPPRPPHHMPDSR